MMGKMDSHLGAGESSNEDRTKTRWRRALAHVQATVPYGPALHPDLDVTIHFHPDRPVEGVPLLRHLVSDGVYRSQFETGTSNGGLTAHSGGDRWRWEHRMFGGAYDDATPDERPKYGSLNYRKHPAGGSVRFGSSHMKLATHVLERVTFCYPDSVMQPTAFGTATHMPLVAFAEADRYLDVLDDHIEAHVHGPLRLTEDVAELVLDPSFRGTAIAEAAELLPFPVTWHHGFRLPVDDLIKNEEFRGPEIVAVGVDIAQDGYLTPKVLGDAASQGEYDPQDLKRVWHYVARFGHEWPTTSAAKVSTGRRVDGT